MRLVKSGELGTPLQIEANFVPGQVPLAAGDNWRLSARKRRPGR
jgi:hypothetical protein